MFSVIHDVYDILFQGGFLFVKDSVVGQTNELIDN